MVRRYPARYCPMLRLSSMRGHVVDAQDESPHHGFPETISVSSEGLFFAPQALAVVRSLSIEVNPQ